MNKLKEHLGDAYSIRYRLPGHPNLYYTYGYTFDKIIKNEHYNQAHELIITIIKFRNNNIKYNCITKHKMNVYHNEIVYILQDMYEYLSQKTF